MTQLPTLARQHLFLWLPIVLSLLVSLWLIAIDPIINNDGVLYLVAAEAFISEGLRASLAIYPWPFLQILIGGIHAVTGLKLVNTGLLVTTLCYALLAMAFVRTVREMGGSTTVQLLALVIVVFSAPVSDNRSAITRDPGMLAFMLFALVELIRYGKTGSWRHAAQWILCITVAFLFRVEALSIALLSPFGLLLLQHTPWRVRITRLAKLIALPCTLLVVSVAAINLLAGDLLPTLKVVEDLGIFQRETLNFGQRMDKMAGDLAASGLLKHTSVNDAAWGVVAVIVALFTLNLVRALTLPYLALFAHQAWQKMPLQLCPTSDRLIKVHLAIIVTYQLAFVFFYQFSLGRYSLQIALLLFLYLPFILGRWWQSGHRPVARVLIVLLLCGYAADTLVNSRHKKAYLDDAAQWLQDAPVAANLRVVANDHHVAYVSGRVQRDDILLSRLDADFIAAHTPWQPGVLYAYRTPRNTDLDAMRADILARGGDIYREFNGGDRRSIIVFSLPPASAAP